MPAHLELAYIGASNMQEGEMAPSAAFSKSPGLAPARCRAVTGPPMRPPLKSFNYPNVGAQDSVGLPREKANELKQLDRLIPAPNARETNLFCGR